MKVKYIGDPRNGGQGPTVAHKDRMGRSVPYAAHGYAFPAGKWVNVPGADEAACRKFAGNSHYECAAEIPEKPARKRAGKTARKETE